MNTDTHIKLKTILDYVYPGSYTLTQTTDKEIGLELINVDIKPNPGTDCISSLNTIFQQIIEDDSVCININNNLASEIEKIKEDLYMYTQKVLYYNQPVVLPAQNAFVRKIVHGYISNKPGFRSESVGVGRERHIVIHPSK
ncbi:MAG: R3H domain-containing nucleic acid-binding protein [Minisyncoccia bacterium]